MRIIRLALRNARFPFPARRTGIAAVLCALWVMPGFADSAGPVGPGAAVVAAAQAAGKPAAAKPADNREARQALRKAVAFHRDAKDMTLRFRAEVYNSALDKRESYEGRLYTGDSTRFRLEIPGGTFVSDGATFWEYHPQNRQVVIRSAKDLQDKPLPGQILLRFLDSDPLAAEKVKSGGKEYLELRLDPSRAMKNLDSLSVQLDPSDHSLHRIASRDLSGNESVYTLLSVKRNTGIKDDRFKFSVPKGAETVDMRE